MTFGGVDTYYDYDERQWKLRRLGGGPVRKGRVCPVAKPSSDESANRSPSAAESPGAEPPSGGVPGRTW